MSFELDSAKQARMGKYEHVSVGTVHSSLDYPQINFPWSRPDLTPGRLKEWGYE